MMNYFTEAEDEIKMDVQVGPQEEIESKAEDTSDLNPVDAAKKDPNTVPVACKEGTFYLDASDVAKYATLNECDIIDALDDIITCNEGSGMTPDNMIIVMSEETAMYESVLEHNGAEYEYYDRHVLTEAEDESQESDIEMDVQVGPNGDDQTVSEDPQEANPVDAVKRQYDSVVVAKTPDDKFFMDVEDVQKCAELNCESVIDTVNGIINFHEDYDMNTENTVFLCGNNVTTEAYDDLCDAGATVVFEASDPSTAARKKAIKDAGSGLRYFLMNAGCSKCSISTLYIGGVNGKFVKGQGNTILLGISTDSGTTTYVDNNGNVTYRTDNNARSGAIDAAIKAINDGKKKALRNINEKMSGFKAKNLHIENGRLGVINVVLNVEPTGSVG